jgi:predicted AAA+ superfamily ATPase
MTDAGLAAWLTGSDSQRLLADRGRLGPLLESFVVMEIRKQLGWSSIDARMSHYRSHDGVEVDLALEDRSGRVVGIEVKASATVRASDVRGLWRLAERIPDRWHRGIVLYLGAQEIPFGERILALPITTLWETT